MNVVASIKATRVIPMHGGKSDQWSAGRPDCSIELANHMIRFEFQIGIELIRGNVPCEYRLKDRNALTRNFPGVSHSTKSRGMDGRSPLTVS